MLKIQDLHVYISSFLHVIQGIDLTVEEGETLFIIGRNGSGKTTLLRSIVGFIQPSRGRIIYKNLDITYKPSYERAKMGIRYVPDNRRLFNSLSVEENLLIGLMDTDSKKKDVTDRLEYVYNIFPDLKKLRKLKANQLSGGQQQMLNIARAIVSPNVKLLLIDEPTEGLSPVFVSRIIFSLENLIKENLSMIIVETKPAVLRKIKGKYVVMSNGSVISQGFVEELLSNKELMDKYLGVTT